MSLHIKNMMDLRVLNTMRKTTPLMRTFQSLSKRPAIMPMARRGFAEVNTSWLGKKEKGEEDFAISKHDEELLKKLRDEVAARKAAEDRAQAAESREREAMAIEPDRPASNSRNSRTREIPLSSNVSMEEFLDFRRDMVKRIRDLEDDLEDLKAQLARRR